VKGTRRGRPGQRRPRPRLTDELLDAPVRHAARVVARAFLQIAIVERAGLPDGSNALHDFRVSVRRLRSWLRAFRAWLPDSGRGRARRSLATLAGASNQARDAEVGLEWLDAQRALPLQARRQLRQVQRRLRNELRAAKRGFQRQLAREFRPAVRALDGELQASADELTAAAPGNPRTRTVYAELIRSHAAELDAALRRVRTVDDEGFAHRARIAGKRLRYLLEPLLSDAAARGAVHRLVRLQDALGELHDACVLGARLQHVHSVLAHRARERTTRAFDRVARGWLGGRTAPLVDALAGVADGARLRPAVS